MIISFLNVTSLAFLEQFLRKNQINRLSNQWEKELDSALHQCSRNSFTGSATSAYKLPLAATIYHLWMEGNARVFIHTSKNPSALLKLKAWKPILEIGSVIGGVNQGQAPVFGCIVVLMKQNLVHHKRKSSTACEYRH